MRKHLREMSPLNVPLPPFTPLRKRPRLLRILESPSLCVPVPESYEQLSRTCMLPSVTASFEAASAAAIRHNLGVR